jgi:hypothetical protein
MNEAQLMQLGLSPHAASMGRLAIEKGFRLERKGQCWVIHGSHDRLIVSDLHLLTTADLRALHPRAG